MIALLAALACGLIAVAGFYAVLRFAPGLCDASNNELVRISSSLTGGLYGLLLAFIVVTAWQNYSSASTHIEDEISALSNVMRDSGGLPDEVRIPVRTATLRYAQLVVDREWASLERGDPDLESRRMYERIWDHLYRYEPDSGAQGTYFGSVVDRMNEVGRARRLRIYSSQADVPSLLWVLIVVGGVMTVFLLYLYRAGKVRAQAVVVGIVAGFIGFVVYLIYTLDNPFARDLKLSTQPFTYFIDQWKDADL